MDFSNKLLPLKRLILGVTNCIISVLKGGRVARPKEQALILVVSRQFQGVGSCYYVAAARMKGFKISSHDMLLVSSCETGKQGL